jgi:integrase
LRYVDADGRRKQRASHQPTREQARRMLVEIEARVARGLVGMRERPPAAPSVAALCERFLCEYSRPRIKDLAGYRCSARKNLQRALRLVGDLPADQLGSDEVARLRDRLAASYAPASIRLCLAFLGRAYSWAMQQGLVATNPLRGVERPAAASSLDYFERGEAEALLRLAAAQAAAGPLHHMRYACLHLAVHTGLRKGELLGLRWQDVDLHTRRLTVARSYDGATKSGKPRHLRLPAACVPVVAQWQAACRSSARRGGLLFPLAAAGPAAQRSTLGLPRLLKEAGLRVPAHPWHALRHTFASHYVMQGGNLLALQKILGHSDVKMTMIYAHLAPDFLAAEMDRVQFSDSARPARKP